jgi:Uma2 family endonuclease
MRFITDKYDFVVKGTVSDNMSDDEFFHFCQQNDTIRIERDANHQIHFMSPTGNITASYNAIINAKLFNWNEESKTGIIFDSSVGFTLPDTSVFSPDASWLSLKQWKKIPKAERLKFAHVCPEFIVEIKSPSDSLSQQKNKMLKWIENGVQLAWLINPDNKTVIIYRTDGSTETIKGFTKKLKGETVLPGFVFDLKLLK